MNLKQGCHFDLQTQIKEDSPCDYPLLFFTRGGGLVRFALEFCDLCGKTVLKHSLTFGG